MVPSPSRTRGATVCYALLASLPSSSNPLPSAMDTLRRAISARIFSRVAARGSVCSISIRMGRSGSGVKMSTVPCGRWRKPAEDGIAGNTIQNREGAWCDAFSVGEGTLADATATASGTTHTASSAREVPCASAPRRLRCNSAAGGVPSAAERQGGRTRHSRRATGRPRRALALRVRHGRLHASPDEPRGRGNAILLRQAGSASNSTASPGATASLRRAKSKRSASRKGCPARHPLGAFGATETHQRMPRACRPASQETCRRVTIL